MAVSLVCGLIGGYSFRQFHFLGLLCFNQFIYLILLSALNIAGLFLFKNRQCCFRAGSHLYDSDLCCAALGNVTDTPMTIEWFIYARTVAYFLLLLLPSL